MRHALVFLALLIAPMAAAQPEHEVYKLLHEMHEATKAADHEAYFDMFTEDAVFLCQELGIETGIDLEKLILAAQKAEQIIGAPLMGRVMHSGGLDRYRMKGRG